MNSSWTRDLHYEKRLHLIYFAVRRDMRGHGIADKLMDALLDYADQHQLLISLETHNQDNIELYQHFGFQIYATEQRNFDLTQYCMIRPAAKRAKRGRRGTAQMRCPFCAFYLLLSFTGSIKGHNL